MNEIDWYHSMYLRLGSEYRARIWRKENNANIVHLLLLQFQADETETNDKTQSSGNFVGN